MAAGAVDIAVVTNYNNGSIQVMYYDNTTWHSNEFPVLQGGHSQNFTSVSLVHGSDLKFYGLTNGSEIHSYKIDRMNPTLWSFDEIVSTN
jgi:hypothetical protein